MTASIRVGVDVGGTFTDVLVDGPEGPLISKVPSTPPDPSIGVLAGIEAVGVNLAQVARFAHGTTVATNTVLEHDGARTALVVTRGFRDLLEIGRQDRPSLYDLTVDRAPPLVPRELVVEVAERIGADGAVLIELTDGELDRLRDELEQLEPETIAVSLLFSFRDPSHEQRVAEAVARVAPVSRSSLILPVLREYERASTTTLNAYVAPCMQDYLGRLNERLRTQGLAGDVEVMRSGGGTLAADVAAQRPVETLLSGPAAGVWGAAAVGLAAGVRDLITLDMGGTSTDVSLIAEGRPGTTPDGTIGGYPFQIPSTDIHTIGAGGGSIAWMDDGGALRVGPRSAGAEPGPACYDRGGTLPTVTDANILLGRLPDRVRLGGVMALDRTRAVRAVADLGERLGLDDQATAAGIIAVVEAQMVAALRVVSVERGLDPRDFTLMPFGGAGPLHQGRLARELGCPRVLVPAAPGVLCSLGLLTAPIVAERARTVLGASSEAIAPVWTELEDEATAALRQQGAEVVSVTRSADLRYRGQAFELEVAGDASDASQLAGSFHEAHRRRYGYDQPEQPVEIVTLRVRVAGPEPDVPLLEPSGGSAADATIARVRIVLDGTEQAIPLLDRPRLGPDASFRGPAVIAGVDATVLVEPWQQVTVTEVGALLLEEARG